jgi:dolichol-phosphate mannosyltransferase
MANDLLIFIPTYNERENVEGIAQQIMALGLKADILFLDDNSPDGTGQILDALATQHPNIRVIHRSGKLGIGSAHITGISRAYDEGYRMLVTMDCDFTHSPAYIHDFIAASEGADVVVGSRYMQQKSLTGWNAYRKILTMSGHFLTGLFLRMPYDATGAFRLYNLARLSRQFLEPVKSLGYSFFFESLYVLHINGFVIREVPILLPARMYGHSKMRMSDAVQSLKRLVLTFFTTVLNRKHYIVKRNGRS